MDNEVIKVKSTIEIFHVERCLYKDDRSILVGECFDEFVLGDTWEEILKNLLTLRESQIEKVK